MPDATAVLTALRNELVAAELVRRPNVAGVMPALHVEPRDGAPAPGERDSPETTGELVVTIRLSSELSETTFDSYRRRIVVDVIYRSSTTAGLKAARALDAAIRDRLVTNPSYGYGFMLDASGPAALSVLQATVYGGLGPVSQDGNVRTEAAKYLLEVLAA